MMRRHLRGSCVTLSLASTASRWLCRAPRYSYASRLKSGGAGGASSRRLCVSQRLGCLAHAWPPVDRRRRPRTRCRQPALARLLPARRRVARHCPRGWHLSAVGANVCCTGATPILPRVSYHLDETDDFERTTMALGTGCLGKCPQIQTRSPRAAAKNVEGPLRPEKRSQNAIVMASQRLMPSGQPPRWTNR